MACFQRLCHWRCCRRNADAVELLVRHGASVNIPVYTREGCDMWPIHKGLLLLKDGTTESLEILAILMEVRGITLYLEYNCVPWVLLHESK